MPPQISLVSVQFFNTDGTEFATSLNRWEMDSVGTCANSYSFTTSWDELQQWLTKRVFKTYEGTIIVRYFNSEETSEASYPFEIQIFDDTTFTANVLTSSAANFEVSITSDQLVVDDDASSILYGFIEFETRLGRPHQFTSQSPSLDSTSLSDVASLLTHTDSNVGGSCTSTTSSVCIQRWRIDFNPAYCSLEGAIVVKWNVWCLRCGGNEEIAVEFQFDNVDLCGKIDPIIRESRSGIMKSYASQQFATERNTFFLDNFVFIESHVSVGETPFLGDVQLKDCKVYLRDQSLQLVINRNFLQTAIGLDFSSLPRAPDNVDQFWFGLSQNYFTIPSGENRVEVRIEVTYELIHYSTDITSTITLSNTVYGRMNSVDSIEFSDTPILEEDEELELDLWYWIPAGHTPRAVAVYKNIFIQAVSSVLDISALHVIVDTMEFCNMEGTSCVEASPAFDEPDILIKIDFRITKPTADTRLEDYFITLRNELSSIASDFYAIPMFYAAVVWKFQAEQPMVASDVGLQEHVPTSESSNNMTTLIIVAIAAVLGLCCVCAGVFFYYKIRQKQVVDYSDNSIKDNQSDHQYEEDESGELELVEKPKKRKKQKRERRKRRKRSDASDGSDGSDSSSSMLKKKKEEAIPRYNDLMTDWQTGARSMQSSRSMWPGPHMGYANPMNPMMAGATPHGPMMSPGPQPHPSMMGPPQPMMGPTGHPHGPMMTPGMPYPPQHSFHHPEQPHMYHPGEFEHPHPYNYPPSHGGPPPSHDFGPGGPPPHMGPYPPNFGPQRPHYPPTDAGSRMHHPDMERPPQMGPYPPETRFPPDRHHPDFPPEHMHPNFPPEQHPDFPPEQMHPDFPPEDPRQHQFQDPRGHQHMV